MRWRNALAVTAGVAALAISAVWLFPSPRDRGPGVAPELTFRIDSFSINLFPPTLVEINSRRIATLLNAPLIRMDENGAIAPSIAASWRKEGSTWRFKIAEGLQFSDGRPITAQDASASICRAMQPGTSWAWSLNSIAQTRQDDTVRCDGLSVSGNELIITQNFDAPWLEQALAGPAGWVLPKDADPRAGYGVVPGAGRYTVKEIAADSHVLLAPTDVKSGLPAVRFKYVADDSQAASLMKTGGLSSLYLQSPLLKAAVTAGNAQSFDLVSHRFDRVRVMIINEARLRSRGVPEPMIKVFRDALDTSIDRERLKLVSDGIAIPEAHPLPIFGSLVRSAPAAEAVNALPGLTLTVLSEPDAFSDQIAAALPKNVGPVHLTYRGLEKGAFLGALAKGDFDIGCLVLEATMHSPKFWASFFEPQGAFVAFGTPIRGAENVDFSKDDAVTQLDSLLTRESNWVLLFRENRIDAVNRSVSGLTYTPSGQDDLADVALKPAP